MRINKVKLESPNGICGKLLKTNKIDLNLAKTMWESPFLVGIAYIQKRQHLLIKLNRPKLE